MRERVRSNPRKQGHAQQNVAKPQATIWSKIEYYFEPESQIFEAQYFTSAWMKVLLIVVMFIPAIVMQGVPETIRDIGNLIHQREEENSRLIDF